MACFLFLLHMYQHSGTVEPVLLDSTYCWERCKAHLTEVYRFTSTLLHKMVP